MIRKAFSARSSYLSLALLFLAWFQNCAPTDVKDKSLVAALGSPTISGSGLPAGLAALTVGYSPQLALINSAITISAAGGTAPYKYAVVKGTGKMAGNVYTASATPELVVIGVSDSIGNSAAVSFGVADPSQLPNGGALPTPPPTASGAGFLMPGSSPTSPTIEQRTCNLQAIASLGAKILAVIDFEFCLVDLRDGTDDELHYYKDSVDENNGPAELLVQLLASPEAQQKYNYASLSNTDFVTFMFRMALFRDPTTAEAQPYLNALNGGADRVNQVFYQFAMSPEMMAGDQYYAAAYQQWYSETH